MADIALIQAAIRTTAGTQDFTIAGFGTPKGAVCYITAAIIDGTEAAHAILAAGATDGIRHFSICGRMKDAVSTTLSGRLGTQARMITVINQDGTVIIQGSFSAWITDGIRINFTTAPPAGYLLTIKLYGGAGIANCYAGLVTTPAVIDTATIVTALGFQFDFMETFDIGGLTFTDASGLHGGCGLGIVQRAASNPHPQYTQALFDVSGVTTTSVIALNDTNYVSHDANQVPGRAVEIMDVTSTGFSAFTRLQSDASIFAFFAVKLNNAFCKVMTINSPTSAGSNTWSGIGFTPQYAMILLNAFVANNTRYIDDRAEVFGVGLMTAIKQCCVAIEDSDNLTPSLCKSFTSTRPVLIRKTDALFMNATFISFTNGSTTLNFLTANGTTRKWAALFVQESTPFLSAGPSLICSTSASLSTSITMSSTAFGICDAGIMALSTDTFDTAGSADLGPNWDPTLRTFKITAGGVGLAQSVSNGGNDAAERNNASKFPRNQYGRVRFGDIATTGLGTGYGVALRMDVGGIDTLFRIVAATSGWEVAQEIATVFSTISNNVSPAFANADILEVAVIDDGPYARFFMKRNGVDFGSGIAVPASLIGSGSVGVYHSSTTQTGTTVGIDTFEAGRYGPYLTSAITLSGAPSGICSTNVSLSTISRFASQSSCICSTQMQGGDLFSAPSGKCSTSTTIVTGFLWTDAGFNFRATVEYAADGMQEIAVIGEFYPHNYLINGQLLIAGWTGTGPTGVADEDNTLDRRLAGNNGKLNDGTQVAFKIKLPQAGNWRLSFALGDASSPEPYQYLELQDNDIGFAIYDQPAGTSPAQWYATDSNVYDSSTWPSIGSGQFLEHGFSDIGDGTAILTVVVGTPVLASPLFSTTLAHLRLIVSPSQGALLKTLASCTCSTLSVIASPMSALASGSCSTNVHLGLDISAQANGTCSTIVAFSTVNFFAATLSAHCSTSAALTAIPFTLTARAGGSCTTPSTADAFQVQWTPAPDPDLAGYKVKYGPASGGPYVPPAYTVLDVGMLFPNLLLWTEDMTNAIWTREGSRVEAKAPAQDGSLNAVELIQTVSTGYHRLFQTILSVPADSYSAGLILRGKAVSLVMVRLFGDAFHSYAAEFDLAQGIITPESSTPYPGTSASMTDLGDGNYLCLVSGSLLTGPVSLYIELNNDTHSGQYAGDASSSAILFAAQLMNASAPALYVGTTTVPEVGYMVSGLPPGATIYVVSTSYDTAIPSNESAPSIEQSKFMPWGLKTGIAIAGVATCATSTSVNLRIGGPIDLMSVASGLCSTNAPSLTTVNALAGTSNGICSTSAVMTSAVAAQFASLSTCKVSVAVAITTGITPASIAICSAITTAVLQFPGALLNVQATGVCATTCDLSTASPFISSPSSLCATVASLTTVISMASVSSGLCFIAVQSITTTIRLAASSIGLCSSSVSFGGEQLVASPTVKCSTSASMTTRIAFAATSSEICSTAVVISGDTLLLASAICTCTTSPSLAIAIPLTSSSAMTCSASASITASIRLQSTSSVICSTNATGATAIRLAGNATGHGATTVSLSTIVILMLGAATTRCSMIANLATAIRCTGTAAGKCTIVPPELKDLPFSGIKENVDERADERGIERGIFSGGG